MRKTLPLTMSLIAAALLAGPSLAQPTGKTPSPSQAQPGQTEAGKPGATKEAEQLSQTDVDATLYAVGVTLGRSLRAFHLSKSDFEQVKKGLNDTLDGQKPKVNMEVYTPKIQQLIRARSVASSKEEKKISQAFLDKVAREPGVQKLPSGLLYRELQPGTGQAPTPANVVKVNYRGTLVDGSEFDSSARRGQPATIPLDQAIPCWTEGLQKVKVGGKAKLYCPPELAYGDTGSPPMIPGGAALVFEVELAEILNVQQQKTAGPAAPSWQSGQPKK